MSQRIDTVDRHYKPVKRTESWIESIFWINILLSFSLLFIEDYPLLENWVGILFILCTVIYGSLSLLLGVVVLPNAEGHRSTNLIADSLGVTLNNEQTNKYYNNNQKPSIIRLGMNLFENSLFSWTVSAEMLKIERIKVAVWIVLLIVITSVRETPIDIISFIAQAIFSTSLLNDYCRLENARYQFKRIHNGLWDLFLNGIPPKNQVTQARILNLANRYESTKASLTTSLDSKIFGRINDSTTKEWEKIKVQLKID